MRLIFALTALAFISACAPSAKQMEKLFADNPEILFTTIEKNPQKFIDVVNAAAKQAQSQARQQQAEAEEQRMEEEFKNPKTPEIQDSRAVFGPKDAPITIVEYSDFQCPYCQRGFNTIQEVMDTYGDKVKVVYKHLPLDFHPEAMPAAQYYEAIAIQDPAKAKKFHDAVFEGQKSLGSGKTSFLDKMAKKVGANMSKLKKDLDSDQVKSIIEADIAEARKFGFSGTPGFLVNGVSLKGAYPFPEFKKVIDRHLKDKGE
jgi:protein-disulfide isomerase